jgi:hypothetical protein
VGPRQNFNQQKNHLKMVAHAGENIGFMEHRFIRVFEQFEKRDVMIYGKVLLD